MYACTYTMIQMNKQLLPVWKKDFWSCNQCFMHFHAISIKKISNFLSLLNYVRTKKLVDLADSLQNIDNIVAKNGEVK